MTTQQLPNKAVANVWTCVDGGAHQWAYLGKTAQMYRCAKCSGTGDKSRLKKETDIA